MFMLGSTKQRIPYQSATAGVATNMRTSARIWNETKAKRMICPNCVSKRLCRADRSDCGQDLAIIIGA